MNETQNLTEDEIRAQLEAQQAARVSACRSEIETILQKYRCQISARAIVTPQGTIGIEVQIVAA